MDLEARIRESRAEASYIFYITIVNGCKQLKVDPPTAIDNPPFTFDLWTEVAFSFNYAQLDPPNVNQAPWYNCGDLMYSLVDAQTGAEVDGTVFSIDTSSPGSLRFRGRPPSRDPWLLNQPYNFKIKVRLGPSQTPYSEVFSEPFQV